MENINTHATGIMDFDACRFDFRLDSKNGLTPSKRKRGRRGNACYNTLFKCKVCGLLFDHRAALLEHKLVHNEHRCPICNVKVSRKATLKEHLTVVHVLGKGELDDEDTDLATKEKLLQHMELLSNLTDNPDVDLPALNFEKPLKLPLPPITPTQLPAISQAPQAQPQAPQPPGGMVCINVPIFIGNQGDRPPGTAMTVGSPTAVIPQPSPAFLPMVTGDHMNQDSPVEKTVTLDSEVPEPRPIIVGPMVPGPSFEQAPSPKKTKFEEDLEPGEIRRKPSQPEPAPAPPPPPPPAPNTETNLPPGGIVIGPDGQPSIALPCNDGTVRMFSLQQAPPSEPKPQPAQVADFPQLFNIKMEPEEPLIHMEKSESAPQPTKRKLSFDPTEALGMNSNNPPEKRYHLLPAVYTDLLPDPDDNQVIDLSMKHSSEPSSTSSSVRPSPSITPSSDGRPRKKPGLDSMVAKLWQTKIKSSSDERSTPEPIDSTPEPMSFFPQPLLPPPSIDDVIIVPSPEPEPQLIEPNFAQVITRHQLNPEPPEPELNNSPAQANKFKFKPYKFHTVKFHNCKVCHQLFDSAEKLWEHAHMGQCQDNRIKCALCDYQGTSTSAVVDHVLQAHSSAGTVPLNLVPNVDPVEDVQYLCTVCRQAFPTEESLEEHVQIHNDATPQESPAAAPTLVTCNFEGCGYSCVDKFHLWHHIQKQHFSKFSSKQKQILCPEEGCGRRFVAQNHLKRHMVVHSDKRPLLCPEPNCGKRFKNMMNLRKHQTTHGPLSSSGLKCMLCEYTAAQPHVLSLHIKERHWNDDTDIAELDKLVIVDEDGDSAPPSPVGRNVSPINQPAVSSATDSVEATENSVPESSISDGSLESQATLEQRFILNTTDLSEASSTEPAEPTASSPITSKYHVCPECKDFFRSPEKLWSHRMLDHEGGETLICNECGFSTLDRIELESHSQDEHGIEAPSVKEYQCTWCGKRFTTRHGYTYHVFKHNDNNTAHHPCPVEECEEFFDSKSSLRAHVRRAHHKHKPACSIEGCCDGSEDSWKNSAEDRPLVCQFSGCDKSFRESKHLKVHMMLHTDEKPLKCEQCDYSCRQRNSLNWHMKSKHGKSKEVTPDGRTIYV